MGVIKIPFYWSELFEDLTNEEVGVIFRLILAYSSGDMLREIELNRKLFTMREEAVKVASVCLEDIRYQETHPRSWRKPEDVKSIRASKEYYQWRKAVYERDHYTCQNCGKVGGKLNAHHIKPFKRFPELRFDVNNGITLCFECHKLAHEGGFRNA